MWMESKQPCGVKIHWFKSSGEEITDREKFL